MPDHVQLVTYHNSQAAEYTTDNSGLRLKLETGLVVGMFQLTTSPEYVATDSDAIQCRFLFRSRNKSSGILYVADLHPGYFWRRIPPVCKDTFDSFISHFQIRVHLDEREYYEIALDNGRKIHGRLKRTPIDFSFMYRENDVVVKSHIAVSDPRTNLASYWQTIFYEISFPEFLWLKNSCLPGPDPGRFTYRDATMEAHLTIVTDDVSQLPPSDIICDEITTITQE